MSVKRFGSRSGPTILSGLILVQTVCNDYQQTTLVGKRVNFVVVVNFRASTVMLLPSGQTGRAMGYKLCPILNRKYTLKIVSSYPTNKVRS